MVDLSYRETAFSVCDAFALKKTKTNKKNPNSLSAFVLTSATNTGSYFTSLSSFLFNKYTSETVEVLSSTS